jgi:hypothetical protein
MVELMAGALVIWSWLSLNFFIDRDRLRKNLTMKEIELPATASTAATAENLCHVRGQEGEKTDLLCATSDAGER